MPDFGEQSFEYVVREIVKGFPTDAGEFDRRVLLQIWQQLTNLSESESRRAFSTCEDVFRAAIASLEDTTAGARLQFGVGGWTVRLNEGLVQGALIAALLPGILILAKCPDIPSALWPTILPILLVIERCRLSKSETEVLAILSRRPDIVDVELPIKTLYEKLPAQVRDMLSVLDFIDVVESLRRAGRADATDDKVKVRSQPAGFRVTFE